MKTPADFATSPAMVALNSIAAIAALAGAVNVMAVKAEATAVTDASDSIINYDTAAQQSYTPQFGKPTYLTTNTNSFTSTGTGVDDTKTTQD